MSERPLFFFSAMLSQKERKEGRNMISGIKYYRFTSEYQLFLQEEDSMWCNVLPAQIRIVSLDLFGVLILTEISWAKPGIMEYNRIAQLSRESVSNSLQKASPLCSDRAFHIKSVKIEALPSMQLLEKSQKRFNHSTPIKHELSKIA